MTLQEFLAAHPYTPGQQPQTSDNPPAGAEVPPEQRALSAVNSAAAGMGLGQLALGAASKAPALLGDEAGALFPKGIPLMQGKTAPNFNSGSPSWFTTDPDVASAYAQSKARLQAAVKDAPEWGDSAKEGQNVGFANVPATKTLELEDLPHDPEAAWQALYAKGLVDGPTMPESLRPASKAPWEALEKWGVYPKAKALGYDSVTIADKSPFAKSHIGYGVLNPDIIQPTIPQKLAQGGEVKSMSLNESKSKKSVSENTTTETNEARNMADGGVVGKSLGEKLREYLASRAAPVSVDVNEMSAADKVDPSVSTDTVKTMADGGTVVPTDEQKRDMVLKALKDKTLRLDDGGVVDADNLPDSPNNPALPVDAPQDSKLDAILKVLGLKSSPLVAPSQTPPPASISLPQGMTGTANPPLQTTPLGTDPSGDFAVATGNGTLTSPPVPPAATQTPTDTTPALPLPQTARHKAAVPSAPAAPAAPNPLDQLGNFDPNTIAPGLNSADRQAVAAQGLQPQHTFGNYLAMAIAGLGDAVAAKGGVQQNSLGNIFALQKQQREEALANFDKAREVAMQNYTAKNQADQALIGNLKARGELQVSPGIAAAIGHPELAGKPVQQADLVIKADGMKYEYANHMLERKQSALKDAADRVEKATAHGGILGTQKMMSPQAQLDMIHKQAVQSDPEAFGWGAQEVK